MNGWGGTHSKALIHGSMYLEYLWGPSGIGNQLRGERSAPASTPSPMATMTTPQAELWKYDGLSDEAMFQALGA